MTKTASELTAMVGTTAELLEHLAIEMRSGAARRIEHAAGVGNPIRDPGHPAARARRALAASHRAQLEHATLAANAAVRRALTLARLYPQPLPLLDVDD